MSTSHIAFSGSIPAIYDACLGPLLFEFSALDVAQRVSSHVTNGTVLEIACGTGISTQALRKALPDDVEIVATDLNPGMLEFAQAKRGELPGMKYEIADAQELPYEANSFECVVCQFGIMFFPDIPKALFEMNRVLKPGGFVVCNIWDTLEANPIALMAHETVAKYFDAEPPSFLKVPFGSCDEESTLHIFRRQGFENMQSDIVEALVESSSPSDIARGFVEGNPGIIEIQDRAKASPQVNMDDLISKIETRYGPNPMQIPFREIVFTGFAP